MACAVSFISLFISIQASAGKLSVGEQERDVARPALIELPVLCRPLAANLLLTAQFVEDGIRQLVVVVGMPDFEFNGTFGPIAQKLALHHF